MGNLGLTMCANLLANENWRAFRSEVLQPFFRRARVRSWQEVECLDRPIIYGQPRVDHVCQLAGKRKLESLPLLCNRDLVKRSRNLVDSGGRRGALLLLQKGEVGAAKCLAQSRSVQRPVRTVRSLKSLVLSHVSLAWNSLSSHT